MHRMLLTCEGYAAEFFILFNASKSECMSRPQSKLCDFINDVKFTRNDNAVESVKSLPHFGHIVGVACDGDDIDRCRYKLFRQINDVVCTFHWLDSIVKIY